MADGPHHRRGQAAEQGDLRHGAACRRPGSAGQRRESGVVQAQAHADAQQHPRQEIHGDGVGGGQQGAAGCGDDRAYRHDAVAAPAVHRQAGQRRHQRHRHDGGGEAAVDGGGVPAQIGRHGRAQGADQVERHAPAD
ncbi:hypothetical protein G6F54_013671 [Rhizopus delemar]|nr:hypothetical protein G6F54_013671 [Rhizopus delemar]